MLVVVDNTTATVLGQQPLGLGADFSLASDTKALIGHGDVVLGHVAVRDAAWAQHLRSWRTQFGAVPGPMEVWLAHRSLGTLDVRLERMAATDRNVLRLGAYEILRSDTPDRVAIKATTSEKMGFTGRGEGIVAFATATVRLPWKD